MRRKILILFLASLLLAGSAGCSGNISYDPSTPIKWNDDALEAVFREWLDKPEGDIYPAELDGVISVTVIRTIYYINEHPNHDLYLSVPEAKRGEGMRIHDVTTPVTDLSDFAYCQNLQRLELYKTSLTKLNGVKNLSGLKNFKWLLLSENKKLKSISGVSSLPRIDYFQVHDMDLGSFSELSGMKNLKTLSLIRTNIGDLTPVGELGQLEKLYIDSVAATDLSPLKSLGNLDIFYFADKSGNIIQSVEDIA